MFEFGSSSISSNTNRIFIEPARKARERVRFVCTPTWGSVAHPAPKSSSKPLNSKPSKVDDHPWGAIAAPVPKTSSKPSNLKSSGSADDDLWASIAAPPPTTGLKPLSSGRGRGTKPAAPKLGAQRINRTSSGM